MGPTKNSKWHSLSEEKVDLKLSIGQLILPFLRLIRHLQIHNLRQFQRCISPEAMKQGCNMTIAGEGLFFCILWTTTFQKSVFLASYFYETLLSSQGMFERQLNGRQSPPRTLICTSQNGLLSSPRAKHAGPKGLRAGSARAVTGRRCPHSGEGEDFLTGQLNFFT